VPGIVGTGVHLGAVQQYLAPGRLLETVDAPEHGRLTQPLRSIIHVVVPAGTTRCMP